MDVEESQIDELLRLHRDEGLEPDPVRLGAMPKSATAAMRRVADDISLRLGLLSRDGCGDRALMYARSEAVKTGAVSTLPGASHVLRRLCDAGVICDVGEMPKLGKRNGTKLYAPPGWRPVDPESGDVVLDCDPRTVVVERGWEDRVADLVWVPDQPHVVGGPVEPDGEGACQSIGGVGIDRGVGKHGPIVLPGTVEGGTRAKGRGAVVAAPSEEGQK